MSHKCHQQIPAITMRGAIPASRESYSDSARSGLGIGSGIPFIELGGGGGGGLLATIAGGLGLF